MLRACIIDGDQQKMWVSMTSSFGVHGHVATGETLLLPRSLWADDDETGAAIQIQKIFRGHRQRVRQSGRQWSRQSRDMANKVLIANQRIPKKVVSRDVAAMSKYTDKSQHMLTKLLTGRSQAFKPDETVDIVLTDLISFSGEASIATVKGQSKHYFDLSIAIGWKIDLKDTKIQSRKRSRKERKVAAKTNKSSTESMKYAASAMLSGEVRCVDFSYDHSPMCRARITLAPRDFTYEDSVLKAAKAQAVDILQEVLADFKMQYGRL